MFGNSARAALGVALAISLAGLPAGVANAGSGPEYTGSAVMTSRALGVNTGSGDSQLFDADIPTLMGTIRAGLFRYPGGSGSDSFNWESSSSTSNWDKFMNELATIPNDPAPLITADYGTASVGPVNQAAWVTNALTFPNYSDSTALWEIGNENYGSWETDTHPNPHTPQSYATNALPYFQDMHAADPNAQLGFPYSPPLSQCAGCSGWVPSPAQWDQTILSQDGSQINWADLHWYPNFGDPVLSDAQIFSSVASIPTVMQGIRSTLNEWDPSAYVVVGETSIAQSNIVYNNQPVMAEFVAATALQFLSHGALSYDWWQLHDSGPTGTTYSAGGLLSTANKTATVGNATLTAPVSPGALWLPLSNTTNFMYDHTLTIDSGSSLEHRKVLAVGGSATLSAPASPGDTTLEVNSVTPFAAGTPITIDSGASQESRTVVAAGSAAASTTLAAPAAAGSTTIHIEGTTQANQGTSPIFTPAGLVPGAVVAIGSGSDLETDTVASVGNYLVGPASSLGTTTVAQSFPGDSTLYVASVANTSTGVANYVGDPLVIDTGSSQEVDTITSVGVSAGTATTLTAPASVAATNVSVASVSSMTAGHPLLLDVGDSSYEKDTIASVGTAAGTAGTLVAPTNVGDTILYPSTTGGMVVADNLAIDTGSSFEADRIAAIGTAAGAAETTVAPTTVGATNVYVSSTSGMTAGQDLDVDTGSNFERAVVSAVGSAAGAATTTVAPATIGATNVYVASISGFTVGHKLVIDAATNLESDTISAVGTAASTATTLAAASVIGATNIKVTSITGLTVGHGIVVDTGSNLETDKIAAVGTAGATGTGVTLATGLLNAHNSGASVRDEGTGITLATGLVNAHAAAVSIRDEGTGVTLATGLTIAHASGATVRGQGTGVTLATPLTIAHALGASVRDEGSGVTLATPLQFAHASGASVRDAGTGITLATPLQFAHAAGAATQDAGSGITLTAPLTYSHPSGEALSTAGTGLRLNAPLSFAHANGATVSSTGVTITPALSLAHAAGAAVQDPGLMDDLAPTDAPQPVYDGYQLAALMTTPGATLSTLPSPSSTVLAWGSYLAGSNQSVMLINDSDTTWATVGLGGLPGSSSTPLTTTSYSLENPAVTTGSTTVGTALAGGITLPPESTEVFSDSAAGYTPPAVSVSPAVLSAPGASVASTLALSLGSPTLSFGTFTPGVAQTYTTSVSADVLSTAQQATLTVGDPSATATGYLVNGSYSLAQPLQAQATDPANPTAVLGLVGSSASPLTLLSYPGPVSHDPVTITFSQAIGATDPLRTGSYGKSLTFTLSTTTP